MTLFRANPSLLGFLLSFLFSGLTSFASQKEENTAKPVSFHKEIRPLLQARCAGCHQPAKAKGDYVMTDFISFLRGGESEKPAIVPGKPDESYLIAEVTPNEKGEYEMPKGKNAKPLHETEIELLRRWISEGAKDDSPIGSGSAYTMDKPPVYTMPPVVTSMDFSSDGSLLAVTGFHEALIHKADGSELVARLVGLSERIESVAFSPDGKKLGVTGGQPGQMGEVQIWNLEKKTLELSKAVTFDTLYGGSWSPDGKYFAFGAADTSVRVIEVSSGKQVVYMAGHDDWVRDTVFSMDGKSVFSVSRDKTVKQTDVATERFIGNVTTHTPFVLSGGQSSIDVHPKKTELLVGGADGKAKLFRQSVKAAPAGGGNPNQIREFGAIIGRIFSVCFNHDGSLGFAGSSLDGEGEVRAFRIEDGKGLWKVPFPETGIYSIACSPDGKTLAVSGFDGKIRLLSTMSGETSKTFIPVEIEQSVAKTKEGGQAKSDPELGLTAEESLAKGFVVQSLVSSPSAIKVSRPLDYGQIIVSARLQGGSQADVTRMTKWTVNGGVGEVSIRGLFTPSKNGSGKIVGEFSGHRVEIPVTVAGLDVTYEPDFIRDVNPVISKRGCNSGPVMGRRTVGKGSSFP